MQPNSTGAAACAPSASPLPDFDVAVVGGGLVGTAIAWGLARTGLRVTVLDEGDRAHRASRGNFALVWVQGKGAGQPDYTSWTRRSARLWPALAEELREETGIDVGFRQPGGLSPALSEMELEARYRELSKIDAAIGDPTPSWEAVDPVRLKRMVPEIGPSIVGATYSPLDGHVNALRLFRAFHVALSRRGVSYRPNCRIEGLEPVGGGVRLSGGFGEVRAMRVVLAAGIDNVRLASLVGMSAPIRPQRGHIIVTEKVAPFLHHPLGSIRQTDEGGIMIGDSAEEAGCDDRVQPGILGVMAERAIRVLPLLGRLNVVRSWAALRVMTRDGFPIYDRSADNPNIFVASCHSGVTLAAVHALHIPPALAGGTLPADCHSFSTRRFHVPTTA